MNRDVLHPGMMRSVCHLHAVWRIGAWLGHTTLCIWRQTACGNVPSCAAEENGTEKAEPRALQHDDDIGEEVPLAEAQLVCDAIVRLVGSLQHMPCSSLPCVALAALRCCRPFPSTVLMQELSTLAQQDMTLVLQSGTLYSMACCGSVPYGTLPSTGQGDGTR